MPTNKSAEANSLVVHIDVEPRARLLKQHPDTYYVTDHYEPYASVLVRVSKITRTALRDLPEDACTDIAASRTARSSSQK